MAILRNIRLCRAQPLARCDAQLFGHQIKARHHFGHRMFHLKAGVHFKEVKGAVLGIDELNRASAAIVDGAGDSGGGFADVQTLRL